MTAALTDTVEQQRAQWRSEQPQRSRQQLRALREQWLASSSQQTSTMQARRLLWLRLRCSLLLRQHRF